MIYAIEAIGLDRVKFGKAKDPEARFKILSTASPVPLQLIIVAPWPDIYEGVIHRAFAEERITGEWFLATKRVEKFCHVMGAPASTDSERFLNSMAYIDRLCPAPKVTFNPSWGAGPSLTPAQKQRAYRERHKDRVREANKQRMRKARDADRGSD